MVAKSSKREHFKSISLNMQVLKDFICFPLPNNVTNPERALGGADYIGGVKKEKKSHTENLNLND